jgi:hypothetical protein
MEKKLQNRINEFLNYFKKDIIDKINDNNDKSSIISIINNYPSIEIGKEDFIRRKRVKNVVPHYERCIAKRANNDQCTRRNKNGTNFCGTHTKGTPHGIINGNINKNDIKKVQVFTTDINGIIYYIDEDCNVYNTEDVFHNKEYPSVIAKCKKIADNTYELI